jgi:hypothetical protein
MSRELLQRALGALDLWQPNINADLIADIRAELQKPEPVECGWVAIVNGVDLQIAGITLLSEGTHRLLAVRIDDE